jgi:hypothetical protein
MRNLLSYFLLCFVNIYGIKWFEIIYKVEKGIVSRDGVSIKTTGVKFRPKQSAASCAPGESRFNHL